MRAKSGESTGIRCPRCGAKTRSPRTIAGERCQVRYRKCVRCGHTAGLKTIEVSAALLAQYERHIAAASEALNRGQISICSGLIEELSKLTKTDVPIASSKVKKQS